MTVYFFYYVLLISFSLFSYALVNANFPVQFIPALTRFGNEQKALLTGIYVIQIFLFFIFYLRFLSLAKRKRISKKTIVKVLLTTVIILFISYPAFSYDIFNYIATAKITFFYRENPYVLMPIEITGEPMLAFMHAANKTALYGPSWIILTFFPHVLSFNNLVMAILSFKLFVLFFYLGTCYLIWNFSKKNTYSLLFFALNPLVLIETLISAHNDIVMIFFAFFSFYLLSKKRFIFALCAILISVLIKYATIILLPIFAVVFWNSLRNKKTDFSKIFKYAFLGMIFIFLLSPIREEMYPWYFIWLLAFSALMEKSNILSTLLIALSLGLELRFAPFMYFRSWTGIVPQIKKIVTFAPFLLSLITLFFLRKWQKL